MDKSELENRFTYHPPRVVPKTKEGRDISDGTKYELVRSKALRLAFNLVEMCPDSRELSLAITHLESAVMWANAAIARRS